MFAVNCFSQKFRTLYIIVVLVEKRERAREERNKGHTRAKTFLWALPLWEFEDQVLIKNMGSFKNPSWSYKVIRKDDWKIIVLIIS